jgi:uncharacterized protein HemY
MFNEETHKKRLICIDLFYSRLETHLQNHHTDTIHVRLGKLYFQLMNWSKATEHFQAALKYTLFNVVFIRNAMMLERDYKTWIVL